MERPDIDRLLPPYQMICEKLDDPLKHRMLVRGWVQHLESEVARLTASLEAQRSLTLESDANNDKLIAENKALREAGQSMYSHFDTPFYPSPYREKYKHLFVEAKP